MIKKIKVFIPPGPSRKAAGGWREPGGHSVCFERPSLFKSVKKVDPVYVDPEKS